MGSGRRQKGVEDRGEGQDAQSELQGSPRRGASCHFQPPSMDLSQCSILTFCQPGIRSKGRLYATERCRVKRLWLLVNLAPATEIAIVFRDITSREEGSHEIKGETELRSGEHGQIEGSPVRACRIYRFR